MTHETPTDPYDAVLGLRVVRKYLPEPVSAEDAAAILEAGRWTGSAKNRQDWLFLVVDDPEQQARLAECGQFSQPLRDARFIVVPVRTPGGYEFDIGRVSQNMMLAAAARGVGFVPGDPARRSVLGRGARTAARPSGPVRALLRLPRRGSRSGVCEPHGRWVGANRSTSWSSGTGSRRPVRPGRGASSGIRPSTDRRPEEDRAHGCPR